MANTMERKALRVASFWVISTLLLNVFRIGPRQSFTSIQRKPQRILKSAMSATKMNSLVWEFNGHKCHAEVAQPAGKSVSVLSGASRPQVILIHGFGCSTVSWRETIKCLSSAGYTVHALDLLGQGKSAKPGREQGVEYSINLWAAMVDSYAKQYILQDSGIVVIGNSLGSVVALAAASGDFGASSGTDIVSRIRGIGMYNCGIGMNSRNIIRDPIWNPFQRSLLTFTFDALNVLIFDNVPVITFLLKKVVTKELLKNVLTGLYQCASDPESRVDDVLVDSFYDPAQDDGAVEALSQIYTNDPGKTPMEFHKDNGILSNVPINLVWGDKDSVTPLVGSVAQFYLALANDSDSKVSLTVVNAGHIPFDEVPECNYNMLQWLERIVTKD